VVEDTLEVGRVEGVVAEEVTGAVGKEDEQDLVSSMRALEIEHFAQVSGPNQTTSLRPTALTMHLT